MLHLPTRPSDPHAGNQSRQKCNMCFTDLTLLPTIFCLPTEILFIMLTSIIVCYGASCTSFESSDTGHFWRQDTGVDEPLV